MNIETNTQELREILDMVYDLPNASGGGSAKADLVITGMPRTEPVTDNFFSLSRFTVNGKNGGPEYITFDQEQVVSVYEKLVNGEEIRAALKVPAILFNSWDGFFSATFQAVRVAAGKANPTRLIVRFDCAIGFFGSTEGTYNRFEYEFTVDAANRTATLSNCYLWTA